jgi:hypothetical protein
MNTSRLIHTALAFLLYAILTACSSGSSLTTLGGQSLSSAYPPPTALQGASGMARPSEASCEQNGRKVTLASTEVKVRFPENCVSGNIRIPGVTNLSTPPQYVDFCQGPQPLYDRHRPKGCGRSEPDGNCLGSCPRAWCMRGPLL